MAMSKDRFQTIRSQGAILPGDVLQRIASIELEGLKSGDYHLPSSIKLNEAISQSWARMLTFWKSFSEAREKIFDADDTGAVITRERWMLPLFQELGYGRLTAEKAPEIDGKVYSIERFWKRIPIHIVGCNLSLDRRAKGVRGAATASPHSLVQEFLNRSDDHLWAFVTNGLQLRILRDNLALSRQSFVEFDLEAMMDGEVYADFALLWLLCHQSRVEADSNEDYWLEKWSKVARDQGTRILTDLRVGVTRTIEALGSGFIAHRKNDELRRRLETGELDKQEYYRQLLRIVYRLLFLFVAEDRDLLHAPQADEKACALYDANYSTRYLRDLSAKIRGSKHADLWHIFSFVSHALSNTDGCPELGLSGLGSFLWSNKSTPDLLGPAQANGAPHVLIRNEDLLDAIRSLSFVERDKTLRAVDYRNLGSEELGSVYESLLELHPEVNLHARTFLLNTAAGNERKTTGSYYTPDSLVQCLLDSALEPVVDDRLASASKAAKEAGESVQAAQVEALLNITVCDPAVGSGHFLIAAAHRLANRLARIRSGESEPVAEDHQHALRDVIRRCIYGVDINPMAAELCRVALWMESIDPGKPLTFLDAHIQVGNSLLGTTPRLLADGIPDDAFKPIEGDVKAVASDLKKRNKKERKDIKQGQGSLDFDSNHTLGNLPSEFARLSGGSDDSVADVADKERRYAELVSGGDYQNARLLADTWCAVFVWQKDTSDLGKLCPTERDFRKIESNPHSVLPHVNSEVRRLADQYRFFHWHLAFPDVFRIPEGSGIAENEQMGWNAGFSVVLGNPPWDRVKMQEKEWFAERCEEISSARNASERKRMVAGLQNSNPQLFDEFLTAKRQSEGSAHVVRNSARFPLCGRGDINTYPIFAELGYTVIALHGRSGLILPTGLVTGDATKEFFADAMTKQRIARFVGFDNEEKKLFPDIDNNLTFAAVTLAGDAVPAAAFCFNVRRFEQIGERNRYFTLDSDDLDLFNPNTRTCPIFRSTQDSVLVRHLYSRLPVLVREAVPAANPFGVEFLRMLDMANDSNLFVTLERCEENHFAKQANAFFNDTESYVPLFEAKMIWHFEHRWAAYFGRTLSDSRPSRKYVGWYGVHYADPNDLAQGRYWVNRKDVMSRVPVGTQFLVAFRDITNRDLERTAVFTILPVYGVGHQAPIVFLADRSAVAAAAFVAERNSFAFDFAARNKLDGSHMTYFVLRQLPTLRREAMTTFIAWNQAVSLAEWILPRVLELTYTAWDLEAFALDCGYSGPPFRWDEGRRFLLRCELDAAYFHLYLGSPSEWGKDSPQLREMFPTPRDAVDYIMETFPIVKRKDKKRTAVLNEAGEVIKKGTYITKKTILAIYDEMQMAIDTGQPYQTRLDPPPGPPTDKEGNFIPMDQWDPANWPVHIHQPRESGAMRGNNG